MDVARRYNCKTLTLALLRDTVAPSVRLADREYAMAQFFCFLMLIMLFRSFIVRLSVANAFLSGKGLLA